MINTCAPYIVAISQPFRSSRESHVAIVYKTKRRINQIQKSNVIILFLRVCRC